MSTHIDFTDDIEKMVDFYMMPKNEFLASYSYLTDAEYESTRKKVENQRYLNESIVKSIWGGNND